MASLIWPHQYEVLFWLGQQPFGATARELFQEYYLNRSSYQQWSAPKVGNVLSGLRKKGLVELHPSSRVWALTLKGHAFVAGDLHGRSPGTARRNAMSVIRPTIFTASGWAGEDDPAASREEPMSPSPADPAPPSERDFAADLLALSIYRLVELRVDADGDIRVDPVGG